MSFGPLELLIILAIVLLLVGGRRLPQLGRQLGGGLREFKDSVMRRTGDQYEAGDGRAQLPAGSADGAHPVDGEVARERR